jgi:hypothetical protein
MINGNFIIYFIFGLHFAVQIKIMILKNEREGINGGQNKYFYGI